MCQVADRSSRNLGICVELGRTGPTVFAVKKYLISYDLIGTSESSDDYRRLIERIKRFPWWGKIQLSTWIIKSDLDAAAIRNQLFLEMDDDDRLFVAGLTGETAWTKVICDEAALKAALTS